MMKPVSTRMENLGTENAFVVLKEATDLMKKGHDIVSFCIGQPDFPTPQHICEAAKQAIDGCKHGYTASPGIAELRQAIATDLSVSRHITVSPESVVVACGAKPFIWYAIYALCDYGCGDEVLYPNPGFPIYRTQILGQGAVPVPLPLNEQRNFGFDLEMLRDSITSRTKLLILNSPHNPTGGVLGLDELQAIAALCIEHDLWVFSDEIYSRHVYDGEFHSIATLPGMASRTIIVDAVSKSYAMTGWRIGYAANPSLAPFFTNLVTNTESCAPQVNQYAALAAIAGPQEEVARMVSIFATRRELIVKELNQVPGFRCLKPGGAFYVYPNITEACAMVGAKNSEDFRKRLLYQAGVAVLADSHFGVPEAAAGHHLRFSYASSEQEILKGIERLHTFMRDYQQ